MSGIELVLAFINVVLLTAFVSPLILWRYRRAVLAGMTDSGGTALQPAPVVAPPVPPVAASARESSAARARAWEARLRRRIFIGVLAALFLPALLLAAQTLWMGGQPLTPAHIFLIAGTTTCSMTVPIFAMLTATPFWRALRQWVLMLCTLAALDVALSMLQRPFYGKSPTLDQAMNFVYFLQYCRHHVVAADAARPGDRRAAGAWHRSAGHSPCSWCSLSRRCSACT